MIEDVLGAAMVNVARPGVSQEVDEIGLTNKQTRSVHTKHGGYCYTDR